MEAEESHQGPELEGDDQFELDGIARVFYPSVQQFLAADGPRLILHGLPCPIPEAIHDIEAGQQYLHEREADGLVGHALQHIAPAVFLHGEVDVGYEKVEEVVEGDGGHHDEDCPLGVGIREAQLG